MLSPAPLHAAIMNEGPFGPVAMMTPFRTFDDAVEQANRLPSGLAAFAFPEHAKRPPRIGAASEAGVGGGKGHAANQ